MNAFRERLNSRRLPLHSPLRREARGLRVVLVATLAMTAIALADVLAPTAVLIAVVALAMVCVTAVYLHGDA